MPEIYEVTFRESYGDDDERHVLLYAYADNIQQVDRWAIAQVASWFGDETVVEHNTKRGWQPGYQRMVDYLYATQAIPVTVHDIRDNGDGTLSAVLELM
jgi:hypothetical protein